MSNTSMDGQTQLNVFWVSMLSMLKYYWSLLLLMLLVVFSGLAVGYVSYENRRLHNKIQAVAHERNAAQVEWGKLLLEHSTLTSPARIETIAHEKMNMVVPDPKHVEVVLP